jgi:hypothetical protein
MAYRAGTDDFLEFSPNEARTCLTIWLLGRLCRMTTHEARNPEHALAIAIGTKLPSPQEVLAAFHCIMRPFETCEAPTVDLATLPPHLRLLHPLLYHSGLWLRTYAGQEMVVSRDLHLTHRNADLDLETVWKRAEARYSDFLTCATVPLDLSDILAQEHPAGTRVYKLDSLCWHYLTKVTPVQASEEWREAERRAFQTGLGHTDRPTAGVFASAHHARAYIMGRSYIAALTKDEPPETLKAFLDHPNAGSALSLNSKGAPDYKIGRLEVLGKYITDMVLRNNDSLTHKGAFTTALILAQFRWFMAGLDNNDAVVHESLAPYSRSR